jgi:predicted DNA-binding protein (MmcQ/YjbR family)
MNVDEIRKYCLSFPHATENLQWGDELCFKVGGKKIGGKIFAILGLNAVPHRVCFKCAPETFAELIERESIRPAPYVGRYKWVLVERLDALSNDECRQLIRLSYEMVAAGAPKSGLQRVKKKTETTETKRAAKSSQPKKTKTRKRPI